MTLHLSASRTRSRAASSTDALPAWPFALPFVGYPLAWVIGIGDLVWILAAAVMVGYLARTRGVRTPVGSGLWLLFLAWVLASMVMIDSPGRLIGFGYRFALYASASIIALYAFAAASVTIRYVTGVMAIFLGVITAGGLLAMAFPLLTFTTPLAHVLPGALTSNELVHEMVVRRTTQWNPDAYHVSAPRPSAPFLYTNTWGNVYSLVLPIAALHAVLVRGTRRWVVLALAALSLVPAVLTLNRGMFIGLGVVAVWVLAQRVRAGHVLEGVLGAAGGALLGLLWWVSPAADRFTDRVSTTQSTDDRGFLYRETLDGALGSPVLGYGAPRPASVEGMPALGTQGQLWTLIFSHGFAAALLFLLFFAWALLVAFHQVDLVGAVLGGVVAATLVETVFYGMMTGLVVSLIAAALVLGRSSKGIAYRSVTTV